MNEQPADDVYSRVTRHIIAAIERGAGEFRMPWHVSGADALLPVNVASAHGYRGVNVLSLWAAAQEKGYESGVWGTFWQWQELGAQVRKGEKATPVVFWKEVPHKEAAEPVGEKGKEDEQKKTYFVGKGFSPPRTRLSEHRNYWSISWSACGGGSPATTTPRCSFPPSETLPGS